jgi:hypothetical protein
MQLPDILVEGLGSFRRRTFRQAGYESVRHHGE